MALTHKAAIYFVYFLVSYLAHIIH